MRACTDQLLSAFVTAQCSSVGSGVHTWRSSTHPTPSGCDMHGSLPGWQQDSVKSLAVACALLKWLPLMGGKHPLFAERMPPACRPRPISACTHPTAHICSSLAGAAGSSLTMPTFSRRGFHEAKLSLRATARQRNQNTSQPLCVKATPWRRDDPLGDADRAATHHSTDLEKYNSYNWGYNWGKMCGTKACLMTKMVQAAVPTWHQDHRWKWVDACP